MCTILCLHTSDRDNVALKGFAKFFKELSEEERGHAEKLMEYQNMRGGRVKLHSILMPTSEFEHVEKGDALDHVQWKLSKELSKVLSKHGPQMESKNQCFTPTMLCFLMLSNCSPTKKMKSFS